MENRLNDRIAELGGQIAASEAKREAARDKVLISAAVVFLFFLAFFGFVVSYVWRHKEPQSQVAHSELCEFETQACISNNGEFIGIATKLEGTRHCAVQRRDMEGAPAFIMRPGTWVNDDHLGSHHRKVWVAGNNTWRLENDATTLGEPTTA